MIEENEPPDKYINTGRNIFLSDIFLRLNRDALTENIRIIPLKGLFYIYSLYSFDQRQMSDIDILVHYADVEKVIRSAAVYGYTPEYDHFDPQSPYSKYINSIVLRNNNSVVRHFIHLHWSLINTSLPLDMFNIDMEEIFSNLKTIEFEGSRISVMSAEHNMLHAVLHAFCHSYDRPGMINDIRNLWLKSEKNIDRQFFYSEACRWSVTLPLYTAFNLIDCTERENISASLSGREKKAADEFCEYVLRNGKGRHNQVYPMYLMLCRTFRKKTAFIFDSLFPSEKVLAAIYRNKAPLNKIYAKRIKNAFLQLKNIFTVPSSFRSLKKLVPFVFKNRNEYLLSVFFTLASMLFALLCPYMIKLMVDAVVSGRDRIYLFSVFIVLLFCFLVVCAARAGAVYFQRYLRLRVVVDISGKLFNILSARQWLRHPEKNFSSKSYNIYSDSEKAADCIVSCLIDGIELFPKFFIILCIVFWLNRTLAGFAFLLVPLLLVLFHEITLKMESGFRSILNNEEKIHGYLDEVFKNMPYIDAAGLVAYEFKKFSGLLRRQSERQKKNLRYEAVSAFAGNGFSRLGFAAVLLTGAWLCLDKKITPGTLTAELFYFGQLLNLQGASVKFFQRLSVGAVSCQRVAGLMARGTGTLDSGYRSGTEFRSQNSEALDIALDRICFSYGEKNIFKDFSCTFTERTTAITGPSGSGKTTLINLILGLLSPSSGTLVTSHDSLPASDASGIVLQEPYLFSATVQDNICYGRSKTNIDWVLNIVDLDIDPLTPVSRLSEGQKQKTALARALICEPSVLIMDEPLSNVDSSSAVKVIRNIFLQNYIKKVIIVTHSREIAQLCDEVLDLGRENIIVEPFIVGT